MNIKAKPNPLPQRHVSFILLCAFAFLWIFPTSLSHAHSEFTGDEISIEHYMNFLERLGHLNIESEVETRTMRASTNITHFPFFNIGGSKVYIDNAFWDMADELSRIYIREIKQSCAECVMPDIEQIRSEAQNLVAKGWFTTKAVAIKDAMAYRYAGQFIGLGAKYGTASGIAKIAGELVEDAMLVVFKMPGAHFLCEAITFVIAYYSGATLTAARSLMYAKYFNRGRISTLVRLGVTSHYIRRALNRMTVEVPEFKINESMLEEFKENNTERRLTYKISGRHGAERFLEKLESNIAAKRARIERLKQNPDNLSKRQHETLLKAEAEGLHTALTIKKKVFDGYKYKRFVFLKKRNSAKSLHTFAEHTSELFRGTDFWFFELKNEIFEPNVITEAEKDYRAIERSAERALRESSSDSITRYQLSQFESEKGKELAAHIFNTLDKIGDKNGKMSTRYLNVTFLDSFYGSVLPKIMHEVVERSVADLDKSERTFRDVSRLQWRAGRMTYFTNIFVDFVRFSAFDKKNADPTMKYNIRDYAIKALEAYAGFSQFGNISTAEDVRKAAEYLHQQNRILNEERFWLEKASQPHLLPEFIRNIGGVLRSGARQLDYGLKVLEDKIWVDTLKRPVPEFFDHISVPGSGGGVICESIYM